MDHFPPFVSIWCTFEEGHVDTFKYLCKMLLSCFREGGDHPKQNLGLLELCLSVGLLELFITLRVLLQGNPTSWSSVTLNHHVHKSSCWIPALILFF